MVITTSDSRTAWSVRIFGFAAPMSMPTSAMACTAAGLTWSAGSDPAERTSTVPADRWDRNAAAIWDRPALSTQTNNTLGFDMESSTFLRDVVRMWNDGLAGGRRNIGKEEPDQAETDESAEDLGGDEEQGRRGRDAGEGVGEDSSDGDRRVREGC